MNPASHDEAMKVIRRQLELLDSGGDDLRAVTMIRLALLAAGLSFKDLADRVCSGQMPERDWLGMAEVCLKRGKLRGVEFEFLHDTINRLRCGGRLSEKQAGWLWAIHRRGRNLEKQRETSDSPGDGEDRAGREGRLRPGDKDFQAAEGRR